MNILVCIRSTILHNIVGGMETITHLICQGLAALGHKVVVATTSRHDNDTKSCYLDNVKYVFLPSGEPTKYSKSFFDLLSGYFEKNPKPDIIWSASSAGIHLTNNSSAIPVVATWHGIPFLDFVQKYVEHIYINNKKIHPYHIEKDLFLFLNRYKKIKEVFLKFQHSVAIFDYMKETIMCFEVPDSNISVIQNGVSDDFKNIRSTTKDEAKHFFSLENKICIGMVGRFVPEKGLYFLVNALKSLDKNKFAFFLVGKGNIDFIQEFGMPVQAVTLSYKEMPIAYRAMDIFINPTFNTSSYDLTIKEALTTGTKTLVSKGVETQKLNEKLERTFGEKNPLALFDVANEVSLRKAIDRILCRKQLDDFSYFDVMYSEKTMAEQYEKLFINVLDKFKF